MSMTTTLDQYVLNFRADLQTAARECLGSLGLKIKDEGDDWLEAHLDSLFSGASTGGAIVEHLKTPSRTATAKKTRAKLEAERQRTDKVKSVNAKLALSPSSRSINASPARLLFQQNNSPLQPRSMNAVPHSPIQSKPSQPVKKQVSSNKPSRAARGDEDSGSDQSKRLAQVRSPQRQAAPAASAGVTSPVTRSTARQAALSPAQSPSRPTKSPLRHATSPMTTTQPRSRPQSPTPDKKNGRAGPGQSNSSQPAVISKKPISAAHKDLSIILEGDSERNGSRAKSPVRQTIRSPPPATRPQSPRNAPPQPTSPRSPAHRPVTHQPSIDSILAPSTSVTIAHAPAPAPAQPAVPVRAVRSSWLSKAIASGAVPVSANANTNAPSDTARKSVVPQSRPTLHNDYAGLRKSLAAPAGMKRKSEEAPEEVEEPPRPAKVVKVDAPTALPPSKPVFERQQSNPSAPSAGARIAAHRTPAPVPVTAKEIETPSEILKVTKALEDIKERNQAKELAKQKAAAAAAAANGQRSRETTNSGPSGSTASGFLRGLTKSLGLGGRTESPEEIAERLHRELEDDRRAEAEAQAELDRLMHEDKRADGDEPEKKQDMAVNEPVERSTTPVTSPPAPPKIEAHPSSDRTEEEDEEDEVVEALSLIEDAEPVQQSPTAPPARSAAVQEPKREPQAAPAQPQKQPVPPRLATPPRMSDFRMSTTPHGTPPRKVQQQQQAPPLHDRAEKHERSSPAKQPKAQSVHNTEQVETRSEGSDTADEEDDAEDDDGRASSAAEQGMVTQHVKQVPPIKQVMDKTRPTLPTSASTTGLAPLAPSSQGLLNQASTIAAKTLGVKPTTAPVKSVQMAQAAAKKEQDAAARKQTFKEQAEARRLEASRKKAEEERARAIEAERIRQQEIERGQKLRAELDRKRVEREEKMASAMKLQAERQQKEAAAAKAKAAEEEANRKRKMAPTLNKSTNANPAKRVAPSTANSANAQTAQQKARETFRPTSSMKGAVASSTTASASVSATVGAAKLGPTSFRTAPQQPDPAQSTVRLVNANPAHLGPPSRPSGMASTAHTHPHPQWSHVPTNSGAGPSNILQQQRVALQSQLDDKALEAQSEDIVLPDIASEYSDSDDSEKSTDFKRPEWAESPELRAALERQATRNPDELFGPIKPISMEELFKVKVNKFRPRSSSANWASGDGVTRKEEIEYARRMGFKSLNPRAEGSSAGAGGSGQ